MRTRGNQRGEKDGDRVWASFHLRTKQVTHAQSPYITVGACKLFNCLAYPACTDSPSGTGGWVFLYTDFPSFYLSFHVHQSSPCAPSHPILSHLIVRPAHWRRATNYWSSIEAREDFDRLNASTSSILFRRTPFYTLRHSTCYHLLFPRLSLTLSYTFYFPSYNDLYLSMPLSSLTFLQVSGLFRIPGVTAERWWKEKRHGA